MPQLETDIDLQKNMLMSGYGIYCKYDGQLFHFYILYVVTKF